MRYKERTRGKRRKREEVEEEENPLVHTVHVHTTYFRCHAHPFTCIINKMPLLPLDPFSAISIASINLRST